MKKLNLSIVLLFSSLIVHAKYEDHFPAYLEYCSGTQWKTQAGEIGGSPGHGFVYIHGMCKDYRSDYPQVIPCDEVSPELKQKFPHDGVGVSLDKNFKNVMWVAVPGREFMLFGGLEPQSVNKAQIDAHIRKVIDLKIFNDVLSKSEKMKAYTPGTKEYLEAISLDTLGTDHATNWARKLHCVKVPVTKDVLPKAASFLNQSNSQYRYDKEYIWSKEANNCIHLSMNTAHSMGVGKSIETDQKFIKKFLNLALPANAFMMYSDLAVLKKPKLKNISSEVKDKGYAVTQVGSLMNSYEVFPSGDYFNTEDLTILTGPRITKPLKILATPDKYEKKYIVPKNSELKANAEMWVHRYIKLLQELKPSQKGSKLESYLLKQLELTNNILRAE